MRLGIMLGYPAKKVEVPFDLVKEADQLGVYAIWTAEAYGSDAITSLAWLGSHTKNIKLGTAIMQMAGRTPANTAMTAMSMNQLSNGRFLLGLGLSGPQVVEGWHGVSYAKPLGRTREYISILRTIFKREEPLAYQGQIYQIPYTGPDATGLGKPLKSILEAQPNIPIYLAAIGPKNVALAAEIADGWLPIFFSPDKFDQVYRAHLEAGFAQAGQCKSLENFDIAPIVQVVLEDDLERGYDAIRPMLALYIGGMGAKGKNFYYDLAVRYGYEAAATEIQALFLSGHKREAIANVPSALIDEVALVGSQTRIQERLTRWLHSPIKTLNLAISDVKTIRVMVELLGTD